MQTVELLIPIESDVNQYIKKNRFMLDNIARVSLLN